MMWATLISNQPPLPCGRSTIVCEDILPIILRRGLTLPCRPTLWDWGSAMFPELRLEGVLGSCLPLLPLQTRRGVLGPPGVDGGHRDDGRRQQHPGSDEEPRGVAVGQRLARLRPDPRPPGPPGGPRPPRASSRRSQRSRRSSRGWPTASAVLML